MSKKSNLIISLSILIAGMLIGGYLVLGSKIGSADISSQLTSFFTGNKNQDPKTIDSDNDGLPDQLEAIYGTDPHNPDTDGDGYLDGEEVMSGYDPLKPAPDDKISDKAIVPRPKSGSLSVNLTDELAKALSETIKNAPSDAFSTNGNSVDLQNNDLIDNALATALAKSPQLNFIPIFQDKDIKISNENGQEATKNYIHQVSDIISKNLSGSGLEGSAIEAASAAAQTKDFSKVDQFIAAYEKNFQEIKALTAPASCKEIHKKTLTFLLGSINIFQATKLINDDPFRTLLALDQYQQILQDWKDTMDKELKIPTQTPQAQP